MCKLVRIATLSATLLLAGCAILREAPLPGEPVAAVTAKLGQPTSVYQAGADQLLEYATGPMGQYTYMARIGPDGRLVSYEQVLTSQRFATIKIDHATKDDVLRTVGRPAETSYLPLRDWEVWTYRYKEADVWNSLMHVHFDRNGVVRQMLNGPDPMYDPRDRFW